MVWEVYRYWSKGWIERYYIQPWMNFKFQGFGWVEVLPEPWIWMYFAAMAVLAAAVAVGLAYRIAMPLFAAGFCYWFLLEQANYLNHFYLISLVSLLLVFVPAHRYGSVDARISPEIRSRWVPTWSVWAIRFQLGVAYAFGGIAKLNGDWLTGRPMNDWLQGTGDTWLIGPFLEAPLAPLLISWGGLLFDVLIVPALLWKRTRIPAVLAVTAFHLTNSAIFSIGIFPWLMLAATPVFFDTPWRRVRPSEIVKPATLRTMPAAGFAAALAFVAWQLLMPMRHHLYPGNVSWTEEGHNFSWHMKLRDKNGEIGFTARDPETGQYWRIDPEHFLSSRQLRKMTTRPHLIMQFARAIEPELLRELELADVEIYGAASVSLNGRPRTALIDPNADLTSVRWGLRASEWVLPLEQPSVAGR